MSTELALLLELAPRLPVAVPRPEHVGTRDGRLVFSAHRALEGEPLSDAALAALPPSARARALDELAAVLDAIHRFPVERARDVSLGHGDFDLAITGAFCGPNTLAGLLARRSDAAAARASASIPFLLTVRRLQDALYMGRARPGARESDVAPAPASHADGGCRGR
jgi:hypothetical protein